MQLKDNYKILSFLLILLSTSSFFLGFYLDENSAGGGSYVGDWVFAWSNLQSFLNNDIFTAIKITSGVNIEEYGSNRPPLLYMLHKLFNPFAESEIGYRRSVFIISLAIPILFYFCLKQKFKKENNLTLLLIASTVFLSPYYRTSAYWGLEENYGFIVLLLTFLFLNYFLSNDDQDGYKIYFQLLLLTFFSSLCIYFDQKLVVIPIICFLTIIKSKKLIKFKILSFLFYLILSLPFIYLMILWGGIFPSALTENRRLGNQLYLDHIGYVSTIIAFYLLPLLLFKGENIINLIKNFFLKKNNYYLISLFFIYLFYLVVSNDFSQQDFKNIHSVVGKGFLHKSSIILFENYLIWKIFTFFSFFVSWLIIIIFVDRNFKDSLILLYFFIFSIFATPILQEYFDPLVFLMVFTFFNSKLFINYKNSIILFLYFSILLISSNVYYYKLLN